MAKLFIPVLFLFQFEVSCLFAKSPDGSYFNDPPVGPTRQASSNSQRDSVLSERLLYILSLQENTNKNGKNSRYQVQDFSFKIDLPNFLKIQQQSTPQYQYKFNPVLGNINLKFFIFSGIATSLTFGLDSRLYRTDRVLSNTLLTRFLLPQSKNQNEIYFRYQFRKFALISSWEFSSLQNKSEEKSRWEEDKIKVVVSYLF